MKFAVITNYWNSDDGGGIRSYLVNLVDALKKKRVDVSVIFRSGDDPDNFKTSRNRVFFVIQAFFYLRKIRPEVIQTQAGYYGLLPGVFYKKFHGGVLIHTFHTIPEETFPKLRKILYQSLLNECDSITFISNKLKEQTIENYQLSFKNTTITYGGAAIRSISETEIQQFKDRFGIKDNSPVLLAQAMVSHPLKIEGLKLLIRAVGILRNRYPDIQLIVTREGPLLEKIRVMVHEMDLEDAIVFTGEVENPFIPLKICDVYTHIALGEGLSLALLEAMAMGKPIIATPVGGIPEAIENDVNGIFVEPDPEKIAGGISSLLENPALRERISANARNTAAEKFTWERTAEVFLSLSGKKTG